MIRAAVLAVLLAGAAATTSAHRGWLAVVDRWAAPWLERAERFPRFSWSAADRSSVSLGEVPNLRAALVAEERERLTLATRSPIVAIAEHAGSLVVGTFDDGIFRAALGEPLLRQPLDVDPRINDLAFAPDGTLYVATGGGAFSIASNGETHKLALGAFSAVAIWRGQPWFTSRRGVSTIDGGGFHTLGPGQGMSADSPDAIADCDQLCVGASDGLWLFDGRGWTHRSSASGDLPADWVTAIGSNDRSIWVGTFDGGLALLASVPRRIARGGLPDARVNPHALVMLEDGALVGTPTGLLALRGGSVARVTGFEGQSVTALAPAHSGMWVADGDEIRRIELKETP